MELNIIKIDLKIFDSKDSVITFFNIHSIEREFYGIYDILYNYSDYGVEFIIFDKISKKILYLLYKDGSMGNIHGFDMKTCEDSFKKPTNILTLTKKQKPLYKLSNDELKNELNHCINIEDCDKAIKIRKILNDHGNRIN